MKKYIRSGLKAILFTAILLGVVYSVYRVLKWKDTTGEYLSSVDQLYATKDHLIDIAFFGSSHCYCGIYPAILWEQYGIAAFDMSVSGQDKDSAYHDLIELYKTQSPAVIYVDLYALLFERHGVESNVYRNYLSLRTSANSVALVNKYIEEDQRKDFIFRFPIIHTRYRELKQHDFLTYAPNRFGRGEYYNWGSDGAWMDWDALNNQVVGELGEKNREWLDDIMELAKKHQTEVVFMVIPFAVNPGEQEILNAAQEYVTQKNCRYLDFNKKLDEVGLSLQEDFSDIFHLNVSGAEKLSAYLGKEISQRYALADHRGDDRYHQWEEDLRWYQNTKLCQRMITTASPSEYVDCMKQFPDGVTVVSLEGDFRNADMDYYELLAPLGMNYEEYLTGGKWLYLDGKLQKIMENTEGSGEFYYDLSRYDRLKVAYYGPQNGCNIMIGRFGYQNPHMLTLTTYDRLLENVVTTRGFE